MSNVVDALQVPGILELLEKQPEYRKSGVTLGRLLCRFVTFVSDGNGGVKVEGENTSCGVVARNPIPIITNPVTIYNEWIISNSKWIELYGKLPDSDTCFQEFRRKGTSKFLEITPEVAKMLGADEDGKVTIKTTWEPFSMVAEVGDYLAEAGHAVNKQEFVNTWELVEAN